MNAKRIYVLHAKVNIIKNIIILIMIVKIIYVIYIMKNMHHIVKNAIKIYVYFVKKGIKNMK